MTLKDEAARLCLEVPLYTPVKFSRSDTHQDLKDVLTAENFQFDCYCIQCARSSTFKVERHQNYENILAHARRVGAVMNATIPVFANCQRDISHEYQYLFTVRDDVIIKVGQFPSIEDIASADIDKFRPVLEKQYFSELHRAGGLASHGLGIASFVYLRRIFERLIAQHYDDMTASGTPIEGFYGLRMDEKIATLKSVLPSTLVENRAAYGILSLGLHELSEQQCLKHYPVVRAAIIAILEEDLQNRERRLAAERLRQAITEAAIEAKKDGKPKLA